MGSHDPACRKAPGPKTVKEKAYTKQKQRITKKKPKIKLLENEKVQITRKNPKKTKNSKKHKMTDYILFPDGM